MSHHNTETASGDRDIEQELRIKRICRMCLTTDEPLTDIFNPGEIRKSRVPLPLQIMASVSLEVFTNDGLPRTVCEACRHIIDYCYRFKQVCRKSESCLKQFPLTGIWPDKVPLPVYPPELCKPTKLTLTPLKRKIANVVAHEPPPALQNKRPHIVNIDSEPIVLNTQPATSNALKTIISPNGSIIIESHQPLLHNNSSSSSSNKSGAAAVVASPAKPIGTPRILNRAAKSGGGALSKAPKGSPTLKATNDGHLELILEPSGDQATSSAAAAGDETLLTVDTIEETDGDGGGDAAAGADGSTNCFPCTLCKRTFSLRQMLDMHMQRHTRDRTAECNVCQKRFYTKYDLNKHALVHSGEKRFMCAVCPRGFSRANLLERHELTHKDAFQHACSFCEKMFVSAEELQRHEERHKIVRKYQCPQCDKSFAFKQGLERHEVVHAKNQPFPCSYCSVGFSTATKLARHLTEHAGERPYPCRLCSKSFLMTHHLDRHMRSHTNTRRGRGPAVRQRTAGGRAGADGTGGGGDGGADEEYANDGEGEESGLLECMVCDDAFADYATLMEHSEHHALESGVCPFCKMDLATEEAAIEHMRQHGEQQFACEFCDLMFAHEEHKEEHCQQEHADEHEMYASDARARAQGGGGGAGSEAGMVVYQEANEERHEDEEILQELIIGQPEQEEAPRRSTRGSGGAAQGKPKILNYIKHEAELLMEGQSDDHGEDEEMDEGEDGQQEQQVENIEDMEFEYVDIIKSEENPKDAPKAAAAVKRPPVKLVAPKVAAAAPKPAAATPKPAPQPSKSSPGKQIPAAQAKLEQQLKDAMKKSSPNAKTTVAAVEKPAARRSDAATTATAVATKPLPVLTKVNVKTLPSGVTLKKVQLNRSNTSLSGGRKSDENASKKPPTPTTAAATATSNAAPKRPAAMSTGGSGTPRATKPAAGQKATPAAGKSQDGVQRVRMTQSQVDAMAREGKIQVKDGQVFLRQAK